MDKTDLRAAWAHLQTIAPAAIGALIGLRYAKDQTGLQKLSSALTGFGLAVWWGPALAELLASEGVRVES